MQKFSPYLWFESNASGVAEHYKTIFGDNLVIDDVVKMGEGERAVEIVTISLFDVQVRMMSAQGAKQFNESFSMEIDCDDQAEIDMYWEAFLNGGGHEDMCGWLKDKYGVSWQIVPKNIGELLEKPGAMQVMFTMKKLVIADLEKAGQA